MPLSCHAIALTLIAGCLARPALVEATCQPGHEEPARRRDVRPAIQILIAAARTPPCDCCCDMTTTWSAFRPIEATLISPVPPGPTDPPLEVPLGSQVPLIADAVDLDQLQLSCRKTRCGAAPVGDSTGTGGGDSTGTGGGDPVGPGGGEPVGPGGGEPIGPGGGEPIGHGPTETLPRPVAVCCEQCPSTPYDRYYVPIQPETDCKPGDVRRNDLDEQACANPIPPDASDWQVQPTYGPRCPPRTTMPGSGQTPRPQTGTHEPPQPIPTIPVAGPTSSWPSKPPTIPTQGKPQPQGSGQGRPQSSDENDEIPTIPVTGPTWFRPGARGGGLVLQAGGRGGAGGSSEDPCKACGSVQDIALASPVRYRWQIVSGAGSLRSVPGSPHGHSGVVEGAGAIYVAPVERPPGQVVTVRLTVDDSPEHLTDIDDEPVVIDVTFELSAPGRPALFPGGGPGITPSPVALTPPRTCACQPQHEWQAGVSIAPTIDTSSPPSVFACAGGLAVVSEPARDIDTLRAKCQDANCPSPETPMRLADALRYDWRANLGLVLGWSDRAVFFAPNRPGLVSIEPTVRDSGVQAAESKKLPGREVRVVRMELTRKGAPPDPEARQIDVVGVSGRQEVTVRLVRLRNAELVGSRTVQLAPGAAAIYSTNGWVELPPAPPAPAAGAWPAIAIDTVLATLTINGQELCTMKVE